MNQLLRSSQEGSWIFHQILEDLEPSYGIVSFLKYANLYPKKKLSKICLRLYVIYFCNL